MHAHNTYLGYSSESFAKLGFGVQNSTLLSSNPDHVTSTSRRSTTSALSLGLSGACLQLPETQARVWIHFSGFRFRLCGLPAFRGMRGQNLRLGMPCLWMPSFTTTHLGASFVSPDSLSPAISPSRDIPLFPGVIPSCRNSRSHATPPCPAVPSSWDLIRIFPYLSALLVNSFNSGSESGLPVSDDHVLAFAAQQQLQPSSHSPSLAPGFLSPLFVSCLS